MCIKLNSFHLLMGYFFCAIVCSSTPSYAITRNIGGHQITAVEIRDYGIYKEIDGTVSDPIIVDGRLKVGTQGFFNSGNGFTFNTSTATIIGVKINNPFEQIIDVELVASTGAWGLQDNESFMLWVMGGDASFSIGDLEGKTSGGYITSDELTLEAVFLNNDPSTPCCLFGNPIAGQGGISFPLNGRPTIPEGTLIRLTDRSNPTIPLNFGLEFLTERTEEIIIGDYIFPPYSQESEFHLSAKATEDSPFPFVFNIDKTRADYLRLSTLSGAISPTTTFQADWQDLDLSTDPVTVISAEIKGSEGDFGIGDGTIDLLAGTIFFNEFYLGNSQILLGTVGEIAASGNVLLEDLTFRAINSSGQNVFDPVEVSSLSFNDLPREISVNSIDLAQSTLVDFNKIILIPSSGSSIDYGFGGDTTLTMPVTNEVLVDTVVVGGVANNVWQKASSQFYDDPSADQTSKKLGGSGTFRIKPPTVDYSFDGDECITGSGAFLVPGFTNIEGSLGFKNTELSELAFYYKPTRPIPAGPIYIKKVYGAGCNLFASSADCPNIQWEDGINLCDSDPRTSRRCIRAKIDYTTKKTGLTGSPFMSLYEDYMYIKDDLKFLGRPLGSGWGRARWSGFIPYMTFGGRMDPIGGVSTGTVDGFVALYSFSGTFKASGQFPRWCPIVGGKTFGSKTFTIDSDGSMGTSFDMYACEIEIEISTSGSCSFNVTTAADDWWPFKEPLIMEKSSSKSGEEEAQFSITKNYPLTIHLDYPLESGQPEFELIDPDSVVYTPGDTDPDQFAHYFHNTVSQDAVYFVQEPKIGIYTVRVLHPQTLGDYEVKLLQKQPPTPFSLTSVASSASALQVGWSDTDPATTATLELYLAPDRSNMKGDMFAGPISLGDPLNTCTHDLVTSPTAAGSYWLMAKVYEDNRTSRIVYSDNPIEIIDPLAPPMVANVQATADPAGGAVRVSWDPLPAEEEFNLYRVQWTDKLDCAEYPYSQAVESGYDSVLIDDLQPGITYRFCVTAIRLGQEDVIKRLLITDIIDQTVSATYSQSKSSPGKNQIEQAVSDALLDNSLTFTMAQSLGKQSVSLSPVQKTWENKSYADYPATSKNTEIGSAFESPLGESDQVTVYAVPDQNTAPVIISDPLESVTAGQDYSYALEVLDPDQDTMQYSLTESPVGMTVSLTGNIQWLTTSDDCGQTTVTVQVSDNQETATQSYLLTVTDLPLPDQLSFTTQPNPTIQLGQEFRYTPQVSSTKSSSPIEFDVLQGPNGFAFVTDSHDIIWSSSNITETGDYPVVLQASQSLSNGQTIQATQYFILNIEPLETTLRDWKRF